jgi:glycosyltransferase involved in cell wall biosynthesis
MPLGCENILAKFNGSVAMARFGQKQVKDYYGINSAYIPHAIDPSVYYPLSPQEKEMCKAMWGLQGKFVVGTVARNQGRKMMDRTIKAFSIFAKSHPDVVLFIHSDPNDPAAASNLGQLIDRYKVQGKVVFSGMRYFRGTEYKDMNKIYGAMDIFFLSTSGEGFGIPIIEAMATGVPPVVTDYTTTYELLVENGRCGEPIALSGEEDEKFSNMCKENIDMKNIDLSLMDGTLTGSWNVERGIMSIYSAAEKMEKLYQDRELIKQYGLVGREKVLRYYSWNNIITQWDDYLTQFLNK